MFLHIENGKKSTVFEDLCDKWLDGRTGKTVNARSSSLILFIYEYKRKKKLPNPVVFMTDVRFF